MTFDLTMAMVKKRIADIDAESLALVSETRRLLRDAKLARAKLEPKRGYWIWSRWANRITRLI